MLAWFQVLSNARAASSQGWGPAPSMAWTAWQMGDQTIPDQDGLRSLNFRKLLGGSICDAGGQTGPTVLLFPFGSEAAHQDARKGEPRTTRPPPTCMEHCFEVALRATIAAIMRAWYLMACTVLLTERALSDSGRRSA